MAASVHADAMDLSLLLSPSEGALSGSGDFGFALSADLTELLELLDEDLPLPRSELWGVLGLLPLTLSRLSTFLPFPFSISRKHVLNGQTSRIWANRATHCVQNQVVGIVCESSKNTSPYPFGSNTCTDPTWKKFVE